MAFLAFLQYFVVGAALLAIFTFGYVKFTPYNEFDEIRKNNVAAAISLGGAMIGFTLPLISVIFYTHSLIEMLRWGAITGGVQLLVFIILRKYALGVPEGHCAPAIFMATLSITAGMLNAICISY